MNAKLKTIASNLMLVSGVITSISGIIETISKVILSFKSKELKMPNKSFGIPDDISDIIPAHISFFIEYRGAILIIIGILIIALSLWIIKKLRL